MFSFPDIQYNIRFTDSRSTDSSIYIDGPQQIRLTTDLLQLNHRSKEEEFKLDSSSKRLQQKKLVKSPQAPNEINENKFTSLPSPGCAIITMNHTAVMKWI